MNRRSVLDAVIVGGGVVGSACALALHEAGLEVALVEAQTPARWDAAKPDLRVFAFAPDNAQLFEQLAVWSAVRDARAQPYRRMRVWDAGGPGELDFDADQLARHELGWIVENGLLVDRLWQAVQRSGLRVIAPARVTGLERSESSVRLQLDDGASLDARIAIAADGGNSALRELAGIGTRDHDYAQKGVVGYIRTEHPHEQTAWQRFLPTGPLAVLPFADGHSSIVWSLPNDEADRVCALDDTAFATELTNAFAARLGEMHPVSPRVTFPLRRKLAKTQLQDRVLLIGDAAHVVHPLAGQGVNLGLRDVAALFASVREAKKLGRAFDSEARLQRWARQRRSDNVVSSLGFEVINHAFSNDAMLPTLLRGHALAMTSRIAPLRNALWRHAAGL